MIQTPQKKSMDEFQKYYDEQEKQKQNNTFCIAPLYEVQEQEKLIIYGDKSQKGGKMEWGDKSY